jgi:hypothetical protein
MVNHTNQLGDDSERDLRFFRPTGTKRKLLSDIDVALYNEQGFLFPVNLFSAEEITGHRDYFESLQEKAAAAGHDAYSIMNWHNFNPQMYDLVYSPQVLNLVEELLGPDLVCFRAHYFCKLPQGQDDRVVTWHQDGPYWPISPSKVVTVWLALNDVTEENGAMSFMPGSHVRGLIPYQPSSAEEKNVLNLTVRDPESYGDGNSVCRVVLKAGQCSLHSDLLLHGSGPNKSGNSRIGIALSYHPPDVRSLVPGLKGRGYGWLCRGSDPDGYWPPAPPRPAGERIPRKEQARL